MSVTEEAGEAARINDGRRRRAWSFEEKRRIVAETYEPGASVSKVARRYDVNTNMLFTWRRRLDQGVPSLTEGVVSFVPATITAEPGPVSVPAASGSTGRMEIVFPRGERLIFGSDIDAAALSRVVKVLVGR